MVICAELNYVSKIMTTIFSEHEKVSLELQKLTAAEHVDAPEWVSSFVIAKKDGNIRSYVDLPDRNQAVVTDFFLYLTQMR